MKTQKERVEESAAKVQAWADKKKKNQKPMTEKQKKLLKILLPIIAVLVVLIVVISSIDTTKDHGTLKPGETMTSANGNLQITLKFVQEKGSYILSTVDMQNNGSEDITIKFKNFTAYDDEGKEVELKGTSKKTSIDSFTIKAKESETVSLFFKYKPIKEIQYKDEKDKVKWSALSDKDISTVKERVLVVDQMESKKGEAMTKAQETAKQYFKLPETVQFKISSSKSKIIEDHYKDMGTVKYQNTSGKEVESEYVLEYDINGKIVAFLVGNKQIL